MKPTIAQELILALIPYTNQNIKLTTRPGQFIRDLGKSRDYNLNTLNSTFYRARKAGYVELREDEFFITAKGYEYIRPVQARKLLGGVLLMVVFDIPENLKARRNGLRYHLKQLGFNQLQKSVWISRYDHEEQVVRIINKLRIKEFVELFECAQHI